MVKNRMSGLCAFVGRQVKERMADGVLFKEGEMSTFVFTPSSSIVAGQPGERALAPPQVWMYMYIQRREAANQSLTTSNSQTLRQWRFVYYFGSVTVEQRTLALLVAFLSLYVDTLTPPFVRGKQSTPNPSQFHATRNARNDHLHRPFTLRANESPKSWGGLAIAGAYVRAPWFARRASARGPSVALQRHKVRSCDRPSLPRLKHSVTYY